MSTILVTGAASGIGRAVAVRLHAAGHLVHAADLTASGLAGLPDGVRTHVADVRSDASIAALAAATGPVDVVIDNAGIGVWGTQEESSLDAVRDMFEVNVLGSARVNQAYLPGLRARKGMVVFVSSISARIVFPESGFYAATKHAVEALAEALYQEVAPDGVRVRVIEPGSITSGFQAAAGARTRIPSPSPYDARRPVWNARRDALFATQTSDDAAATIVASLDDPRGFLRVPVGEDAERMLTLRAELTPDEWVRLMAERNGAPQGADSPLADPTDPHRVTDARRLANTYTALTLRHLDHWTREQVDRWRDVWRSRFAGI